MGFFKFLTDKLNFQWKIIAPIIITFIILFSVVGYGIFQHTRDLVMDQGYESLEAGVDGTIDTLSTATRVNRIAQGRSDSNEDQDIENFIMNEAQQAAINFDLGESGYIFAINDNKTLRFHSLYPEKVGDTIPDQYQELSEQVIAESEGYSHEDFFGSSNFEFEGEEYITVFKPWENIYIIGAMSRSEILEPAYGVGMNLIILFGITTLITIGLIFYISKKSVRQPVESIQKMITRFSNRDLEEKAEEADRYLERKDEIGDITRNLANMRKSLADYIQSVDEKADQVTSLAQELSATIQENKNTANEVSKAIEEISSAATNQAQDTDDTSSMIEEMGNQIQSNQEIVETLNDTVNKIEQTKNEGAGIVDKLTTANKESQESTEKVYQVIRETNDSAEEIQKASEAVREIAEQTNLLALNAAIEAARAGEYGRGFSVVADEIRKLAEDSNEYSENINQIVTQLTDKVKNTVETVDTVRNETIPQQNQCVSNTSEKFQELAEAIDTVDKVSQDLNKASEKMAQQESKIQEKVQNLAAIAEENSANTEESSASMEEQSSSLEQIAKAGNDLAKLAEEMKESVSQFKI
ncbi:methyl-accepting chemotaxis protein [Natranaerobius thermophilus]|uniref:Methyl-accepting chemotaxis sensory transducer n=1 Tax=Natranaerobius thermophilus (strain ATCC BAA-1301 / DSM 18059 / JW/NM-WN-LF) TaxID=457570 RepID=B2A2A2_NATTJ|nr:methyl-accepting chemotaxis protein [Natranaerobius thermophilus]ACB86208.1 methyl-accepting chemotaxis sensory transducer [Natranaerobius thermophilus JW/NM-WN-LF]